MASPSRIPRYGLCSESAGLCVVFYCEQCGREVRSRPAVGSAAAADYGRQVVAGLGAAVEAAGRQAVGDLLQKIPLVGDSLASSVAATDARPAPGLTQAQLEAAWRQVEGEFRQCSTCGRVVCCSDFDEASARCVAHLERLGGQTVLTCPQCGTQAAGARFCPNCGTALGAAPGAVPARKASSLRKSGSTTTPRATPATASAAPKKAASRPRVPRPAAASKVASKETSQNARSKPTPPRETGHMSKRAAARSSPPASPSTSSLAEAVVGIVTQQTSVQDAASTILDTVVQQGQSQVQSVTAALGATAEQALAQIRTRSYVIRQSDARYEVFFTTPGDSSSDRGGLDERLAAAIDAARGSVDVAAFDFDLPRVAEALVCAHRRGVIVRLVTDTDNQSEKAVRDVKKAGIKVVADRREAFMHNKFVVLDAAQVWTGSWNLTWNCTYRNNNNVIVIHSPELARNYIVEFEEMWGKRQFGADSPASTPHARVRLGSIVLENYFAPEDDVLSHILPILEGARSSIRFLAFAFTENTMAKIMARKCKAGLKVQGVMDARNARATGSELTSLRRAGADVRIDGNPYAMHDKVIVVDEAIVVTGSFNFTGNAQQSNDENVLILHSPDIAQRYLEEFSRIYRQAEGK